MSSVDCERGFVHLDSLDQLFDWSEANIDPLQQANTPLLVRPEPTIANSGKSKVMLIHDYKGSFLDYESCQGALVEEEQYSCEYLQYVDSFVYFSHKLVTVPPPTWTNACHRNGVKVLGTLIFEQDTLHIERMLEQQNGRFWAAERLARIAEAYGFDGWIVNIERPFPLLQWSASDMEAFLRQLRSDLGPDRQVVWYDALTPLNVVWYQNTLNSFNLSFAVAAGAILTNYAWNPRLAEQAKDTAIRSGLGLENVYFGIDAWAQNVQDGKYPRVTYPPITGGGTGIGIGVELLAQHGFNVGIFGPGWSFEHFSSHKREMERAIWLGDELPIDLPCDCTPSGLHLLLPYQDYPTAKHAQCFPAGSRSFFYTDFARAFTRCSQPEHPQKLFAHIGGQAVLPVLRRTSLKCVADHVPYASSAHMFAEILDNPSTCSFSLHLPPSPPALKQGWLTARLRIFDIAICTVEPIALAVTYRKSKTSSVTLTLVVNDVESIEFPEQAQEPATLARTFSNTYSHPLRTIDLVLEGQHHHLQQLGGRFLGLKSLTLKPKPKPSSASTIHGLCIERRERDGLICYRMVWKITQNQAKLEGVPVSRTTGSFAYFRICVNDCQVGRAYALEFELPREKLTSMQNSLGEVEVTVVGVGFDGSVCASRHERLSWPDTIDEGWVILGS